MGSPGQAPLIGRSTTGSHCVLQGCPAQHWVRVVEGPVPASASRLARSCTFLARVWGCVIGMANVDPGPWCDWNPIRGVEAHRRSIQPMLDTVLKGPMGRDTSKAAVAAIRMAQTVTADLPGTRDVTAPVRFLWHGSS